MAHLFLIHLLGVCLLLSQPSRAFHPKAWWKEIVQPCGHELALHMIDICSQVTWERAQRMRQPVTASGLSTEITPSSNNKDADFLNRMECTTNFPQEPKATPSEKQPSFLATQEQYQPTVTDSSPGFEDFEKPVHNRQVEAEDSGPSELEHSSLNTYSRKKRQISESLSENCCRFGCTRRSISSYC